jgi:hypothetical protein
MTESGAALVTVVGAAAVERAEARSSGRATSITGPTTAISPGGGAEILWQAALPSPSAAMPVA